MISIKHSIAVAFIFLSGISCSSQKPTATANDGVAVAFPGAEGFGKFTTGGRGGRIFIVSNLDDSGPGSLREAAEAKFPRTIVFSVSGTIHLITPLVVRGNATIAGQSAPGDGICLADRPVSLGGDNIIIRYLRFRMGDRYQDQGMVHGGGSDDALGGTKRKNIIIDHCSISWSTDECFTVYGGDSTTLQWNLISEPLNYSYHFETGDKDFEHHGFGGIWGGKNLSAHHNLFAHCTSRNPRFNGARLGATEEFVDFRNNVIYNWGGNNVYGGEGGRYNIVNNYYKYGPATSKNVRARIVNPTLQEKPLIGFGKFFVDGNFVESFNDVTRNNYLGIHMGGKATELDKREAVAGKIFNAEMIETQAAEQAFELVMNKVGCSLPARDTLDQRIINNVKNRTGTIIDVQGGYPHGTPYPQTANAWPVLNSVPALPDSDKDGIPDEWEKKRGLNPADPTDALAYTLLKGYTNIEVWLADLVNQKNN